MIKWRGFDDWQAPVFDAETYRITNEGRLQREQVTYEPLPPDEWPTKPGDEWHGIVGTVKTLHGGWVPVEMNGILELRRENDEYHLTFEDGKVINIVRKPPRPAGDSNSAVEPDAVGAGNDDGGQA